MSDYLMEKHIEDWLEKYELGESIEWNHAEANFLKFWMQWKMYTMMKEALGLLKSIISNSGRDRFIKMREVK